MSHVERLRRSFGTFLTALLWLGASLAVTLAAIDIDGDGWSLAIVALVLAIAPTAALWITGTGALTRQTSSLAAVGQVMALVYLLAGHPYQPDLHMMFFAVLAILAAWLDWRVVVTCTIAIAVHHALLNVVYPDGVFPGGRDSARVLLHAFLVLLQAGALVWIVRQLKLAFERAETEQAVADTARRVSEDAERRLAETTLSAALERQRLVLEIADDLEEKVAGIAHQVSDSVEPLRQAAGHLSAGARRVASTAQAAASGAAKTIDTVAAVAHATRDLVGSIGEIRQQVAATTRVVNITDDSARHVLSSVSHLSQKASDIGQIVHLIATIAERTNLLALNASIEAARFGKQGQGFAVVAQEVKALANQTSLATAEIHAKIAAIRKSGEVAASAVSAMSTAVGSLSDVSNTMAAAVQQQDFAASGIAGNMAGKSQEAESASLAIRAVSDIAQEADDAAHSITEAADRLASQAASLDDQVRSFLVRIRNAA